MEGKIRSALSKVYYENTLLTVIFMALAVFFGQAIFPEKIGTISGFLIPLFIIVICLEIYFIRTRLTNELVIIKGRIDNKFEYQSFSSGETFDNYLANRFSKVKEIKVIHISSSTSDKRSGRKYYEILDDFIISGGKFRRIFSGTFNKDVFRWIREDLDRYKDKKYFIHCLDKVIIDEISTLGVMIIDDEEVCIGGGYMTSFKEPTISIRNSNIVRFYLDYFEYLRDNSIPIRSDSKIKMDKLIEIEKRIEKLQS